MKAAVDNYIKPSDVASILGIADRLPLYQVLSNLPVAVMLTDDELNITFSNASFCRLFDLRLTPTQIQGINWLYLSAEVSTGFLHASETCEQLQRLMQVKEPAHFGPVAMVDATDVTVDYFPVYNHDTVNCHGFVFTQNMSNPLTEQVSSQMKLYENILHNLPSDVAVFSPDSKYLYLNPAAVKNDELRHWMIGKTDFDYCVFQNRDMVIAENRKKVHQKVLASKKPVEWEEQMVNPENGQEYHLRKMSPMLDEKGNVSLLIGYGMNISERKKIENRIQLSEKRYHDLFKYSQAIICTHDLQGNFLTVNPALCESVGYNEEEMVGKNLKAMLPPEDYNGLSNNYLLSFASESKAKGVFRIIRKDGRRMYLLYENFKVEEAGMPPYIIGFAHDITDRINAEKELKVAKKITEETSQLKERFLANMSHEIRTPMNGILGMANLLQKTGLNTEQQHFLRIINESAQNLLTIINDILDIEKIAAGEVHIESIPFDIVAKTRSVVDLFEYTSKAKGINFVFDNKLGEMLTIEGDPTRYNQVLNNLISNAVKFTNKGSITITTAIQKQYDNNIILEVSITDTGIGIEENKLIKIFEPFAQAYPDTTRKYGGTGLGLAITKNLVELQGGSIMVKSTPGYGSKFTFTISYKTAATGVTAKPLPDVQKPVHNDLGKLKVLLAEDNEVNQLLARSIMMYWGLETKIASTGNEVMELLEHEDFDVILMDIQMPEKNGLEATEEIRNLHNTRKKNIPIIALTANALKGEEKKYIAVGMDDFLTKPFKENELYEVISRVLKNKGSFGRNLTHEATDNSLLTSTMREEVPTENERLYSLKLLNELSRGNQDFILSLVKIFINTIPKNCSEMAEAAENKNWEKVSKLAHKLKSTVDTMHINTIRQDIRSIEINAKNKVELVSVCNLVDKVSTTIAATTVQLKQQFNL